ncbi:spore germination protein [Piscibacillus halophilus]|uniref:Spore germination protein PF n=1 Tax=Piscibacillus halophilus TaxID=571933 RepID=A0A1H9LF70_9BACI|nr:spore germination protein [Piscibacillus halophilus]SER10076.1 spore germination protein PF [Piscibacillus halophilus]
MPTIVGSTVINSVDGGTINFGDSFYISPKSSSESNTGSGSLNTGFVIHTNNLLNSTGAIDPDISDQPIISNA